MENQELQGTAQKEDVKDGKPPAPATLVVGVQFRTAGKIYSFTTTDPTLVRNEPVAVEVDDGTSIGFIVSPPAAASEENLHKNIKRILHRASTEEIEEHDKRREMALKHFETCREKILEHNLEMKLIDAEIVEGGRKIIFFFFAEQRVDFRNLVKDLAGMLRMRIEMRQIGARDESKLVGSIGPCGLATCCSGYLRQFKSISISMAKQQGLTPNPAKLTGMCGKLKCCLSYEHAAYQELRKGLPKLGAAVDSPKGPGKIVDLNILKRECGILLYGGAMVRCPCSECTVLDKQEREKAITNARQAAETADERPSRRRGRENGRDKRKNDRKR